MFLEDVRKKLLTKSKRAKMEQRGKLISFLRIALIVTVVVSVFYLVASKGLATFSKDKINVSDFLFGASWNPGDIGADGRPMVGALPMIVGSFIVTFLSAIVATPFAIGAAVLMTETPPKKGVKFLQPATELPAGTPFVVYGFIGLSVIASFVRSIFGGTGFGILADAFVLSTMILPTVTTMIVDALKAVPRHYREAPLVLNVTRWQTICKVVLRVAAPDILTAVVSGMARVFGEALVIRMVIGNAVAMPTSLTTPASTLTSILTMEIENTIMGTVENNVLWSLTLILLLMSLLFNIVIRVTGKRGALK